MSEEGGREEEGSRKRAGRKEEGRRKRGSCRGKISDVEERGKEIMYERQTQKKIKKG